MPACSFCKNQYENPRGLTIFTFDGKTIYYCSSKCRSNAKLGRDPKKTNWVKMEKKVKVKAEKVEVKKKEEPKVDAKKEEKVEDTKKEEKVEEKVEEKKTDKKEEAKK